MRPARVLVVDDEPLIRHSLRLVIDGSDDLVVVGEAADGVKAVELARTVRPELVLMDIRMPGGDGIEATRRIVADPLLAGVRVVILSMFDLDEHVHAALVAGASGFLLKDAPPAHLVDALRRARDGESLFAPAILTRLVSTYVEHGGTRPSVVPGHLTPRETEVLTLIGRGLSNDQIREALFISTGTLKSHIGSLRAKLQARDRAQLVIVAYEHGLVGR